MHPLPAGGRRRILLRELRRRVKHLKRCESLPSLRLTPENRPVFVCQRCQFPNLLSELCPWCFSGCTCDVAALVAVIRRRSSSPALLTEAQKMQLVRIERRARGGFGGAFLLVATSSPGPRATRVLPAGISKAEPETDNQCNDVRRRHRNAALYSATDVVATATSDTTLQSFLDQISAAHQENRERERRSAFPVVTASVRTPSSQTSRPASSRVSRPHTPQTPRTTRMSIRDVDLTSEQPPSEASAPPSPSLGPQTSQTPCLRRKRRMSVLRQRSSCSLRRRATTSSVGTFCRDTATSPPSSPRPKTTTSLTSTSRPSSPPRTKSPTSIRFSDPPPGTNANNIPLGHPQRPLYTAIRKNMSRPESPSPQSTSARPNFDAAFQTLVYERQTRSLDIETPRYGSLSRASHLAITTAYARPAMFASTSGFSVSGETELRMDLARSRSMDGVPSDFAFREVRREEASMKTKVKNFGKTLKGLLRVKM